MLHREITTKAKLCNDAESEKMQRDRNIKFHKVTLLKRKSEYKINWNAILQHKV